MFMIIFADTKFTTKKTTLYIHNPVQSDTNEYTCEATNYLGSATMTFHVEILGKSYRR